MKTFLRLRHESGLPAALTTLGLVAPLLLSLAACSSTSSSPKREKGRDGTVAYQVEIVASSPGARIEVDNDYIGNTPVTWKVFGDKDGTFHNFGSYEIVVRAYPTRDGERIQKKVFHTGGWFQDEDLIPKRIYFDMTEAGGDTGFSVDLPKQNSKSN